MDPVLAKTAELIERLERRRVRRSILRANSRMNGMLLAGGAICLACFHYIWRETPIAAEIVLWSGVLAAIAAGVLLSEGFREP